MAESTERQVVAAVIERAGCYLVAQRPAHKHHGGFWEFPGGKVAPAERLADALARELREELGVHLRAAGRCLLVEPDPASGFNIHFIEALIDGEPQRLEHSALAWCTPAEVNALALAPADARFGRWLLALGRS